MDGDRKYHQRGYQDSGNGSSSPQRDRDDRGKPRGPRPPIDITGPRLPRLVEAVTASRCYNCATTLPSGFDFSSPCPKCKAALHCCKQCSYFEPSTRFQCTKPIPVRIPVKDAQNDCTFFRARVTVARDAAPASGMSQNPQGARPEVVSPKTPDAARIAFDNLFKK